MSISMVSPSSTRARAPSSAASGEMWPMQRPDAAGEAAVGDEGAGLAQSLGLEVAGGVEHLLHARGHRAGLRSG